MQPCTTPGVRPGRPISLFLVLLVLAIAVNASAGTYTVFGPNSYARTTSSPDTVTATFAVNNPAGTYTLRLLDGDSEQQLTRVSSATVIINGTTVISPNDFNGTTPNTIERAVTLAAANTMKVEVRGSPGSGFTLLILGVDADLPTITATVSPAANAAGWHRTPVTVTFHCSDATSGVSECPAPVVVSTDGAGQVVGGIVRDNAENQADTQVTINLDSSAPALSVTTAGGATNAATARIAGRVFDENALASLTVGGTTAPVTLGDFAVDVPLGDGASTVVVAATDIAGNVASRSLTFNRFIVPVVAITSPADLATVRTSTVTISGTVSDPAAAIRVNGVVASVTGNNFTANGVPLQQGRTVITAVATSSGDHVGTATAIIYRDSIPPRVVLHQPLQGTTVHTTPINVSGMVDDIVVGTINSGQATIAVNGVAAEVANRAWIARNVALTPGPNTLVVTATDQGGNAITVTSTVNYQPIVGQRRIVLGSGNDQRANIGADLAQPLVVRLLDTTGTAVTNELVTFEVVENNGVLRSNGTPARTLSVRTDAQGNASAIWTLGTRAGAGNQRAVARAAGYAASVDFTASGNSGAPALVVIDTGNSQFGAVASPLARPLIACVVDRGSNRIANVPVTFTVTEGGGSFGGQQTVTINTDADGRAWVTPTLGAAGMQAFNASVNGAPVPATYTAVAKVAGPTSATRISGVILDNTDLPVPGVSVRIEGSTQVTQANDQGQFTLTGAPVGYVKLIVDGSTSDRSGSWPMLEYAMHTIAGADNTLEMPIHILPIDLRRGITVDEQNGGTLTLPEMPGFSLTVAPGAATFPGGGRTGLVSVTAVHVDKVPMAPGFGQQPRFIVTIQPPGVHFDPPAAISFPNVDGLQPGEVTEMYSFDHDLGQFVSIGTASVSADGNILSSDRGVGIVKGGWHCGGNPAGSGTTHNCPTCKKCDSGNCVTDPAQNCRCTDNKVCVGGTSTAVGGADCGTNSAIVPGINRTGNPATCASHSAFGLMEPTLPPTPAVNLTACKGACIANLRLGAWSHNLRSGLCPVVRTAVANANDPAITATNYCTAITDLTPDATGRANRFTFYSPALTTRHENFHATDWEGWMNTHGWPAFETATEAITVPFDCTIRSTTDAVNQQLPTIQANLNTMIQNAWNSFTPAAETRAYADGRASYQALATGICTRARAAHWNTSNPCTVCP
jgi:hypothetical protein